MSSALDSTRRRGGKNKWGSSHFYSPHIVSCLQSLAQRNLHKGVKRGRFGHFLLQLSLSFGGHFPPPPSTYVSAKLAKVSMKVGLILYLKGISRVGLLYFE
jgi:hypothetical protein